MLTLKHVEKSRRLLVQCGDIGSDGMPVRDRDRPQEVPVGATCAHPNMAECCDGCGHWSCPDCGLSFDDGAGV